MSIPPAPPPLRLASVSICGYRGFSMPFTFRLTPPGWDGQRPGQGRNLLLYGENGSGKSSLGKALRDFLDPGASAPGFDDFRYRYTDPPRTDREIILRFDDPAVDPLRWNPTSRDAAHRNFADMARSRGWLDYRVVWRASEAQGSDSVEIFRPLVEEILSNCLPSSGGAQTFGQAWTEIIEAAATRPVHTPERWREADELEGNIELFNASLQTFLVTIEQQANAFLQAFTPWTSMAIEWHRPTVYRSAARGEKLEVGSVQLRMRDRDGTTLNRPSEELNEARLTAVGLCLYLAGLSQSIPPRRADGTTYPRLLVLDDVLLSLDMSNRVPLLKLLRSAEFQNWQIFLLTHDRAWYEIACQRLGDGWIHQELFAQRVGGYDQPLLREDQDHLLQAIDFLETGFVKAAAVHVRAKFEEVLKSACHRLSLAVKYHPDPRKVSARDYWSAVSGAVYEFARPVGTARNAAGAVVWWQPPAEARNVVSSELRERIDHALSWVMNPLSHSQSVDRYRDEIEDAIFAVNDLEWAVKEALTMKQAGPVVLRQMLLSLLAYRLTI